MGRKKLTLTSLFIRPNNDSNSNGGGDRTPSSSSSLSSSHSSWAWPSCKHPRTESFRGQDHHNVVYKTVNSVFFESATTDSFLTHSTSDDCCCSDTGSDVVDDYSEAVIRRGLAASSDRLFFEPGGKTSSILKEESEGEGAAMVPFKESVAMAMESEDPYGDFRRSMEEMVVAHGMRDWECLEALLVWYLRANGKKNHGFIVGAFVDLLVALASPTAETEAEKDAHDDAAAAADSGCGSCSCSCSNSMSSVSFEIEEVEEGSGSC